VEVTLMLADADCRFSLYPIKSLIDFKFLERLIFLYLKQAY